MKKDLINRSDALDILDQFQDAVENGENFYSVARLMICELPNEVEKVNYLKQCMAQAKSADWGDGIAFALSILKLT